jgi:DNA-binding MarR family transcriptional regulator
VGVTDQSSDHLLYWLEAAQRRAVAEVLAGGAVPADLGLRRLRLLTLIPPSGARQQDLAALALVSKQAVAELIGSLEADGLVRRTPDPADRRAWRVRRTAAGERALDRLLAGIRDAEDRLAAEVGVEDYRRFTVVLRRLAGAGLDAASGGTDPAPAKPRRAAVSSEGARA